MPFVAQETYTCESCSEIIPVGASAWLRKGHFYHETCTEEGKRDDAAIEASHAAEYSGDVDIPRPRPDLFGVQLDYLPFQRAGIAYALGRRNTLIADEMGLGKSVQAIGFLNAVLSNQGFSTSTILIICPASLVLNWKHEIKRWYNLNPDWIIVTSYDNAHKVKSQPDVLIVDEAQYCKNQKTKRTQVVQALARNAKRVLLLSGTPMVNRPVELWPLLQILDPLAWDPAGYTKIGGVRKRVGAGEGAGFFSYALRYCNAHKVQRGDKSFWDFTGASNLDELQARLRSTVMVRRLKADVLHELPAKRRQIVILPGDAFAKYKEIDTSGDYDDIVKRLSSDRVLFAEISKIRHEQALAKLPHVIDHITDALDTDTDHKIIVFAHHRDVIEGIAEAFRLSSFGCVTLHGEHSEAERQAAVDVFQDDSNCRIFVGSIGAAGVGITLTAASHVIFAELDWVPGRVTQAEDRAHRIGQKGSVLVQHLVIDGSLDAKMCKMLVAKQEIIDRALDREKT